MDAGKRSTVMALRMEVARLRKEGRALEKALETREAGVQNLHKARIEADAELRKALRRSRRQKATIGSLTREKARLGKRVRVARRRIERLEARLAKLRASRSALPKGIPAARASGRSGRVRGGGGPAARCAGPRPHGASGA